MEGARIDLLPHHKQLSNGKFDSLDPPHFLSVGSVPAISEDLSNAAMHKVFLAVTVNQAQLSKIAAASLSGW